MLLRRDAILKERLESTQSSAIEGVEGWRFLPAEIKHLLAGDPSEDPKRPLEAIVDFSEQLKALGVRLIVVPIPAKATVHPEFLDSRLKEESVSAPEAGFYESLRAKGVEVLDLTPEFANARSKGPVYCARDTHWNGSAIALAAHKLAEMLQGVIPKTLALEVSEEPVEIQGDLGGDKENSSCASCVHKARPDAWNPTVRVRFSFWVTAMCLFFTMGVTCMPQARACPDQLAFELGAPVDVLGVRGSGATSARVSLARRARARSDYLTGKKVIIWCFGARELTQADAWKPVPLMKPQDPSQ